jgi:hypothetical protein
MATSAQTLVTRTRTLLRDWPTQDALTVSLSSFGTIATVAATSGYQIGWRIQIDQEAIQVASLASSTTLTILRAAAGTTAAQHANGAGILIRPGFLDAEILDGINVGIDACYPTLYKEVLDTSLSVTDATVYEYTIPTMPTGSAVIDYLSKLELKAPGDYAWRETARWEIRRGATPKVKFHEVPAVGTAIRLRGFGPFQHLAIGDSLDTQWPQNGDQLPVLYAASQLLASGEAGRVRFDQGARDDREAANRPGAGTAAGRDLLSRFVLLLEQVAPPPLPPHIISVF